MSILDRAQLVAAHEAPALLGVPAGTVRYWASHLAGPDKLPLLAPRGLDGRGRPLYSRADLEALRDRPRRTGRARRVDRERPKPNTDANGTTVSAGRSEPRREP